MQVDWLSKLVHELKVPLVAFRAAIEQVEAECRRKGYVFDYDHLGEIRVYLDVMSRLLREVDSVRLGPKQVPLHTRATLLLAEVIAPALRAVAPLLKRRGVDDGRITLKGMDQLPRLHVDSTAMTQVAINILENAIKYSDTGAAQFQIEVEGCVASTGVELFFRDNGIGVPQGMEAAIFQAGVRGPDAEQYDVAGQGLGLWLAREVVERHGGHLALRSRHQPTVFSITLPIELAHSPPNSGRNEASS